jgi:YD repeat-containing protein
MVPASKQATEAHTYMYDAFEKLQATHQSKPSRVSGNIITRLLAE